MNQPTNQAKALQVVITDCPWEDNSVERRILEASGFEVRREQCNSPEEVTEACKNADALIVGWAPITAEVIRSLPRCRLLMRYGVGYNNIDVEEATKAGVAVAINGDYCTEEVATHALALLMACHRQLNSLQAALRDERWDPLTIMCPTPPLSDQVVGVLGYGKIGRCFVRMVRPLVKRVLIHDPAILSSESTALKDGTLVPFDKVLYESDYISIHVPLTSETHHLFNADTFAKMKNTAYLINCARGPIIDEQALVDTLRSGRLAGAALDVFHQEPLPMDHALWRFTRVIITPHAAWYSTRADYLLRAIPAQNIVRFFRGEKISLVNCPLPKPASL